MKKSFQQSEASHQRITSQLLNLRTFVIILTLINSPLYPNLKICVHPRSSAVNYPSGAIILNPWCSPRTFGSLNQRPPIAANFSGWFHAPPRFDDWLLYHTLSPVAGHGRGLATGALYDTTGTCLATVAQEGSVRFR